MAKVRARAMARIRGLGQWLGLGARAMAKVRARAMARIRGQGNG